MIKPESIADVLGWVIVYGPNKEMAMNSAFYLANNLRV